MCFTGAFLSGEFSATYGVVVLSAAENPSVAAAYQASLAPKTDNKNTIIIGVVVGVGGAMVIGAIVAFVTYRVVKRGRAANIVDKDAANLEAARYVDGVPPRPAPHAVSG